MADVLPQEPVAAPGPASAPTEAAATDTTQQDQDIRASLEEVWYLKEISFRPDPAGPQKKFKIITQNYNG